MENLQIEKLINQIQQEAEREEFPIDIPVYESANKNPYHPVLYAGNLKSDICFFGRDLGKDEVANSQPLIGAAGSLVRQGFYKNVYQQPAKNKQELNKICDRLLLTNTVPYKPPGNKAYSTEVKERFRPFIEQLLVIYWQGKQIITLGNEAFFWYSPYGRKGELKEFFERSDRYSTKLIVNMVATDEEGRQYQKEIKLLPLPHPSPLNQKYYALFPSMLEHRLNNCDF